MLWATATNAAACQSICNQTTAPRLSLSITAAMLLPPLLLSLLLSVCALPESSNWVWEVITADGQLEGGSTSGGNSSSNSTTA